MGIIKNLMDYFSYSFLFRCNFCCNYVKKNQPKPIEDLLKLVEPYRRKNGEADCIVPYSGGRDSTYSLYTAVKLGLRPLAVHFDNGWNSDIAVSNIKNATSNRTIHRVI